MGWLIFILVIIAFFAYPIIIKITLLQKKIKIFWLPYVFGGYAKPWQINLPKTGKWININLPKVLPSLVFERIKILKLYLKAEINVIDDPFISAMVVGGLRVAAGNAIAVISAKCRGFAEKPDLQITMSMATKELVLQAECIIRIRIGNIIVAWIKARINMLRTKKLRKRRLNGGGSNPIFNADSNV